MTHRTFLQCLAAIAVLTLAFALWPRSRTPSPEPAGAASASTAMSEGGGSIASSPSASAPGKRIGRPLIIPASASAPSAPTETRVNAAQVLAMVNQTPVQLRHLMALRPGTTEEELTAEQYNYRLQRAIEMELAFQAAREQGVELTPAQKQRVEQLAAQPQTDLEQYKQAGLTWSTSSAEQVVFEQRLLTAQLLEQNLVAKRVSVSPSPDPETQARYEQARRAMLDQLQASANVTRPPGR